jgi:hypothetical protein
VTRRALAAAVFLAPALFAAEPAISVRGRLEPGEQPILILGGGRQIQLHGDDATMGVLADERLKDTDFEVLGHWSASDRFEAGLITSRSLFVHKDGKSLMITYWCSVCSIRTYTPGPCVCCRKYTDLDLRESDDQ